MSQKKDSRIYRHFKRVLILTDIEIHAQRDQQSMKSFAPMSLVTMTSGAEALDHLSENEVDLILCDSSLTDMAGVQFVRLLRQNMKLKMLPVVMVTLENRKSHVLDAVAAGCIGYILRPYSIKTLERYLTLAKQLIRYPEIEDLQLEEAREMVDEGNFDEAIETFEEILSIQEEAQRYYDMGCDYLMDEKYGKAIVAFKKAVRLNDLFAEAYKGLAEAYMGKGDQNRYTTYMQKASEVYAHFDRLEEAKDTFVEILKFQNDIPNPYNTLGVKLRRQGDLPGAVHAYQQALEITPEDENIYFNLAKAYYFMGDLNMAGKYVLTSLDMNPMFPEAEKLYARMFKDPWKPPKEREGDAEPPPPGDQPQSAKDI